MKSNGLEVSSANIMTTPDGRSKGCGIVEFATPEAAQQAVLTLNDSELAGRQIFVREDREAASTSTTTFGAPVAHRAFSTDESAKTRRVYVGNLSWDVAWQVSAWRA
jgi:RNA recognition motif-containing protein